MLRFRFEPRFAVFFFAWWRTFTNTRKPFIYSGFQAIVKVMSPETAWWWFVVAMWCFVWKMWIPDSGVKEQTTTKTNTGVRRCAQDEEFCWGVILGHFSGAFHVLRFAQNDESAG
jgi:hypothetical protein